MAPPEKKKKTESSIGESSQSFSPAPPPPPPELSTKKDNMEGKVFNDPIHGHMEFHPFLVKIIDTPQFQRLRYIKQLGGAYYVYPGASHNRFEHSLGVAHLAGELARRLKEKQPELKINQRDILCVEIAGLCHDLGHGPFSHMFDAMFIPRAQQEAEVKWKHEMASVQMFDYIVENLKKKPNDFNLEEKLMMFKTQNEKDEENDLVFIREMINGPKVKGKYKGRGKDKFFLYEIVANKRNGIDVDKFDYFARDCHHLGIKNSFDHHRFIKFARVCEVKHKRQICLRDKELPNIYEMFHTRSRLHQKAYQHKTSKLIELMITEAFLKADKKLNISSVIKDGKVDIERYTELTDDIFGKILHSEDPDLQEAKKILNKVVSRKIYRYLGKTKMTWCEIDEDWKKNWKAELAKAFEIKLKEDDFEIIISKIDFGKKNCNPMNYLRFYSKSNKEKAFKIPEGQVSVFLMPQKFSEIWIYVYYKGPDENTTVAYNHFYEWCREKVFPFPRPPTKKGSSGDGAGAQPETSS